MKNDFRKNGKMAVRFETAAERRLDEAKTEQIRKLILRILCDCADL